MCNQKDITKLAYGDVVSVLVDDLRIKFKLENAHQVYVMAGIKNNCSNGNITGRLTSGYLSEEQTAYVLDKLTRIMFIFSLAAKVLTSQRDALYWLMSPQSGLGDVTPISLLSTRSGTYRVEDLLNQIYHSCY